LVYFAGIRSTLRKLDKKSTREEINVEQSTRGKNFLALPGQFSDADIAFLYRRPYAELLQSKRAPYFRGQNDGGHL
jgi:hypothetical protein